MTPEAAAASATDSASARQTGANPGSVTVRACRRVPREGEQDERHGEDDVAELHPEELQGEREEEHEREHRRAVPARGGPTAAALILAAHPLDVGDGHRAQRPATAVAGGLQDRRGIGLPLPTAERAAVNVSHTSHNRRVAAHLYPVGRPGLLPSAGALPSGRRAGRPARPPNRAARAPAWVEGGGPTIPPSRRTSDSVLRSRASGGREIGPPPVGASGRLGRSAATGR